MDNPFRRQGSDTQPPGGFLASLQIFDGILNWLAGFIRLTEEGIIHPASLDYRVEWFSLVEVSVTATIGPRGR